jgi:hypothetical protein
MAARQVKKGVTHDEQETMRDGKTISIAELLQVKKNI